MVHFQNPSAEQNPADHADHYASGVLVEAALKRIPCKKFLYTGYSVRERNESLQGEDLFWKTGMFAAYDTTVYELTGYSTLKEAPKLYMRWCEATPVYTVVAV